MEQLSRLGSNEITFPSLGIDITVSSEAFVIFGLSIKWYGIMIALGMLLAMIYCFRRTKEFGLESDRLTDAVFAGLVGAVIGARLYYVVLHSESYHDITEVLAIRDGGLAIYGGIIGALIFGCITAKLRKLRIRPTLDIAAMGFLIGQCAGRWGNFFNQEAFGGNTSLPWGMSGGKIQAYLYNHRAALAALGMEVDPFLPVHPCFLYESLWCLAGFLILHFYHRHRKFDGEIFCMYVLWYGAGRAVIEGLRTDSLYIGNARASQLLAVISASAALVCIIIFRIRAAKKGVSLYRDSGESKALIEAAEKAEAENAERAKAARGKKIPELTPEQRIVDDDEDEDAAGGSNDNTGNTDKQV